MSLIIKKGGSGELLYNPIAFWHLEENSENRIDATNNAYTLSEGDGSVPNTIGKIGNAANFDGTSNKFLTNSSISVGSTFSIACWVKLNSYNPTAERAIWGLGAPNSTIDPVTLYISQNDHFFGIYNSQSDPGFVDTSIVANLDTWYHIVSVFTPNDMKLYINGNLIGSETYVATVNNSWTNFSLSNFYESALYPRYPIDAVIDEVGIWDIELSQEQVTNIYRNIPTVFKIKKSSATFSDTIYWGEDSATACGQNLPVAVVGDGPTFCESNIFTGSGLTALNDGGYFISYGGQLKTVNHVAGNDYVTFNGGCDPC
jgi:hypothetical protein